MSTELRDIVQYLQTYKTQEYIEFMLRFFYSNFALIEDDEDESEDLSDDESNVTAPSSDRQRSEHDGEPDTRIKTH